MSQLDRTTFYSPIPSTKVLAPPGGGNSEEDTGSSSLRVLAPPGGKVSVDLYSKEETAAEGNNTSSRDSLRVLAPPGGRVSLDLFGGYGEEVQRAPRKQREDSKVEMRVVETPKRRTRNILVSSPPGGVSSVSLG